MASRFAGRRLPPDAVIGALAVVLGVLPLSATAQSDAAAPEPGAAAEPRDSGDPSPRASTLPVWRDPPVHFVAFMGYDLGGKKLVEAKLSDGSTQSISASQGFDFSVGAAFLKAFDGKLATQATIGIEGWSINASNASVQWLTFPVDVLEFVYVGPARVGAGISYLLSPKLWGTGDAKGLIDHRFKDSLGVAVEADWVSAQMNRRRSRMTLGGRYVWQRLQQSWGGPTYDASSFAILLGYTG